VRTLFGWISHRLLEQIKPKHEEEELARAASVDIDVEEDVQRAVLLAEQVYEEDVAKAVQAQMLEEKHVEAKNPKEDWSFGFVGSHPKKTKP
jgi:hypothetical protein